MRWVDRGPEPSGVAGYARQFTQGWINHFQTGTGGRPNDSYWREFRSLLGSRTGEICWYCERRCYASAEVGEQRPTVDHFRPLNRFPELAYEWSNWIFSCQRCNDGNKKDSWPDVGYVNPCAPEVMERPERYFDYDMLTGELIPKDGLAGSDRRRALLTIDDLSLNGLDVRFYRLDWARGFVADLLALPVPDRQPLVDMLMREPAEYAGVTGMVVQQMRREGYV